MFGELLHYPGVHALMDNAPEVIRRIGLPYVDIAAELNARIGSNFIAPELVAAWAKGEGQPPLRWLQLLDGIRPPRVSRPAPARQARRAS